MIREEPKTIFYGGAFNPIHKGHLEVARWAHNKTDLHVVFIPNGNPPTKTDIAPAKDRLEMCKLSLIGFDYYSINKIELYKKEPCYTVETVRELQLNYLDSNPSWLIGLDNLLDLPNWYEIGELFEMVTFLCGVYRDLTRAESDFIRHMNIKTFEMPKVDIRSTKIREYEKTKEVSTCDMMNFQAWFYMGMEKLYGE